VLDHHRGGAGPPLVLIHGLGSTWRAFRPVIPLLEGRFDVLAPDMPGFGRSPALREGVRPTPEALAGAVAAEMDRAGFERAHLAGNSLGGWVAAELARRGRARSAVLLSPVGLSLPRESAYAKAMLRLHVAVARANPNPEPLLRALPLRVAMGAVMFGRPWRGDPEELAEQSRLLAGARGFETALPETLDRQPRELDRIDVPVLVAWGTRDRLLFPRQGPRWARIVPAAELRYLPGLGHLPMADDPALVADTIAGFAGAAERQRVERRPSRAGAE
jgi:pimeloyl-ACP methyl ester carboxylesterase